MEAQKHFGRGLHDAEVLKINEVQLAYNYREKDPRRNYLEIELNAAQALFDQEVKAVRLYNYKIIEGDLNLIGAWWLSDQIDVQGAFFIVKMQFRTQDAVRSLTIKCSEHELIRPSVQARI